MMKKYVCLIISVLMLMSLSQISVFAADETPIGPLPLLGINETQFHEENFDSFSAGAYVPAEGDIQIEIRGGSASAEITDDKMLKNTVRGNGSATNIRYDLQTPIETGLFVVSLKMDDTKTTGSGAWTFAVDSTIGRQGLFVKHATSTIRNNSNVALSTQPAKDENGLYHFLLIASRESTAEDWSFTAYDVSGAVPVSFFNATLVKSSFPNMSAFRLTSYSTGATLTTAIDDFKVATYESWRANLNHSYDFDNLEEGEYTSSELSSLSGIETTITGGTGTFEVTADKKLKMTTPAANATVKLTYQIPSVVKTGMITGELKISKSEAGSAGPWALFGIISGSNTHSSISLWGESHEFKFTDGMALLETQPMLNEETQMFHLRATLFRIDENADWNMTVYDDAGETPVEVYKASLSKEAFPSIDKLRFISSYSTRKLSTTIDDISFKALEIENNFADNNTTDSVLSMGIGEEFITGDLSVVIADVADETKTVKATASYDSDSQTLNITPESFLDYGKTYNVTLSGCALSDFAFKTAEAPLELTAKTIKFVGTGGESETIPEGTFDAVCDIEVSNPSGAQATVYAVLISYNQKGMIINIVPQEFQFSGSTLQDRLTIPGLTNTQTANVCCFVWNKTALGYEMME